MVRRLLRRSGSDGTGILYILTLTRADADAYYIQPRGEDRNHRRYRKAYRLYQIQRIHILTSYI